MAVYTAVGDDALTEFLAHYDVGELLSAKGIAEGVENTNYLVRATAGTFILTLYEQRVDAADLPFFLGLMSHLSDRGIAAPRPVARRDGSLLSALCGRPAALVTFLDGLACRRPAPWHCAALGTGLARFHQAAADFAIPRRNALGRDAWAPLFAQSRSEADGVVEGLRALVDEELAALTELWPTGLPDGVIHADLFPDNVFFIARRLSGLIDFYFACNDLLAYDLAVCINAWCFEEDGAFNVTKARALTAGYNAVRPLDEAERAALPVLCRGAALRFLLTRLHDWLRVPEGAMLTPKPPGPYQQRLIFHRSVQRAEEYGIDADPLPVARAV